MMALSPGTKASIFVLATVSKGLEPVFADLSRNKNGYPYSLASAIVMVELTKATVCFFSHLALNRKPIPVMDMKLRDTFAFILPAVMLAVANHTLFIGITYLGALLNQMTRKAVCIMATAVMAQTILGQLISRRQKFALILLMCGFFLLLPNIDKMDNGFNILAVLVNPGFFYAIVGGCCTAGQGVYYEKAAKAQADHTVWTQTFLFSGYGIAINGAFLIGSHMNQIIFSGFHDEGFEPLSFFKGFDGRTWMAIFAISLADITMTIVFKFLDATSYNFCRVFATWVQGIVTFSHILGGDAQITFVFFLGSVIITIASLLYKTKTPIPCFPGEKKKDLGTEFDVELEHVEDGAVPSPSHPPQPHDGRVD